MERYDSSTATHGLFTRLRELWRYRQLLRSLTVRNLKVKYQRSVLGFLWTLLNPLLTVAVLAAVFSYVVKIRVPHYLAFLLSGYFVWNFILQTLSSGTYVLAEHAQLSRSVAFPKEVPLLAATASRLVEFGVEMGLVVVALALFHHHGVPLSFALLPWLVLLQLLLSLGLLFPLATLSVFYHDIQHALPIALTMLFYLSPVFYPANLVPDTIRSAYMVNPIAQVLTVYRVVIYEGRAPSMTLLASLTLVALLFAWGGYALFNRCKSVVAEIV